MTGKLMYVTGPSGTGVDEALRKYQRHLTNAKVAPPEIPHLIFLERHLKEMSKKWVRDVLDYDEVTLFRVLQLPKPLLQDLWVEAFDQSLAEAEKAILEGKNAIVSFHATWYHHQNREYMSAVNLQHLAKARLKPTLIVTLIDDVYDVRRRLSRQGGLFADRLDESLSDLEDIVMKLILILDWRMIEQLVSEKIAACCARPHYLLAVKHPLSTFRALLASANTKSKSVYLSHPISEPRRMLRDGRESEAKSIIESVARVAGKLRERLVVFEPTSIDEARFEAEAVVAGPKRIPVPQLGTRWPLLGPEDSLLFTAPAGVAGNEFGDEWTSKAHQIMSAQRERKAIPYASDLRSASGLLAILRDAIARHINLRDHKLIDQSDGLVIYRPFLSGKLASGVQEESSYHHRLVLSGKRQNRSVVLHLPADESLIPREALRTFLRNCSDEGRLQALQKGAISEPIINEAADAMDPADLDSGRSNVEIGSSIANDLKRFNLAFKKAHSSSFLGKDRASEVEDRNDQIGADFRHELESYSYLNELADKSAHVIAEELSPEVFAERAVKLIEQKEAVG